MREVHTAFGTLDDPTINTCTSHVEGDLPDAEQHEGVQFIEIRVHAYGDDVTTAFVQVIASTEQVAVDRYRHIWQTFKVSQIWE